MKEQRQKIIDNSIDTELATVEGGKSRFVDYGFVRPVTEEVPDYANSFINAVKNTTAVIESSDKHKGNVVDQQMKASVQARLDHDALTAQITEMAETATSNQQPMTGAQKAAAYVTGLDKQRLALDGNYTRAYQDAYKKYATSYTVDKIALHNSEDNRVVNDNILDDVDSAVVSQLNNDTNSRESMQKVFDDTQTLSKDILNKRDSAVKFVKTVNTKVKQLTATYAADVTEYYKEVAKARETVQNKLGTSFKLPDDKRAIVEARIASRIEGLPIHLHGDVIQFEESLGHIAYVNEAIEKQIKESGIKSPKERIDTLLGEITGIERSGGVGKLLEMDDDSVVTLRKNMTNLTKIIDYQTATSTFNPAMHSVDDYISKLSANTGDAVPTEIQEHLRQTAMNAVTDDVAALLDNNPDTHPSSLIRVNAVLRANAGDNKLKEGISKLATNLLQQMRDPLSGVNYAQMIPYLKTVMGGEKAKNTMLWQTLNENVQLRYLTLAEGLGQLDIYGNELIGLDANAFTDDGMLKVQGQSDEAFKAGKLKAQEMLTELAIPPGKINENVSLINYFLSRGADEGELQKNITNYYRTDLGTPLPGFKFKGSFNVPSGLVRVVQQNAHFYKRHNSTIDAKEMRSVIATSIFASTEKENFTRWTEGKMMPTYTETFSIGFEEDGVTRRQDSRERIDWSGANITWSQASPGVYMMNIENNGAMLAVPVTEQQILDTIREAQDRAIIAKRSMTINEAYYGQGYQDWKGGTVTGKDIMTDVELSPGTWVGPSNRWVQDVFGDIKEGVSEFTPKAVNYLPDKSREAAAWLEEWWSETYFGRDD